MALVAGTLVVAAGTAVLLVIFRRFGGPKAGGQSHLALMFGLIGFIFLACGLLFALSYVN